MALRNIQQEISKAVAKHLRDTGKVTPYDERVASLAHLDLLLGPLTLDDGTEDEDFAKLHEDGIVTADARLNFRKACEHLRNLDLPADLYYEEDSGEVMESEPQGYYEDDEDNGHTFTDECDECDGECEYGSEDDVPKLWVEPMPYYHLEGKEVLAAVFAKDLADYI